MTSFAGRPRGLALQDPREFDSRQGGAWKGVRP